MQNRTTNWTFDLHVENQLVCSTLNEKYFQEGNKVRLKSKEKNHSLHTNTSLVVCPSITLILVDILDVSQPIVIKFSKHIQYNSRKPYSSLINTCMLDILQHKVYFCHAWFQSMQWFLCKIFQKGPILNSIPRVKTIFKLYSRARVARLHSVYCIWTVLTPCIPIPVLLCVHP
jgi:hypothetical protein